MQEVFLLYFISPSCYKRFKKDTKRFDFLQYIIYIISVGGKRFSSNKGNLMSKTLEQLKDGVNFYGFYLIIRDVYKGGLETVNPHCGESLFIDSHELEGQDEDWFEWFQTQS